LASIKVEGNYLKHFVALKTLKSMQNFSFYVHASVPSIPTHTQQWNDKRKAVMSRSTRRKSLPADFLLLFNHRNERHFPYFVSDCDQLGAC